jgi:tRNA A-37 threonylcarbamoyl transferase component Bud32
VPDSPEMAAPLPGGQTSLPPALLAQAARRLRVMGLLYAAVFFFAGTLPVLLLPVERAAFLASPLRWVPTALSIGSALLVAVLASRPALRGDTVLILGHVYQVLGSVGIACAEYLQPAAGTTAMSPYTGLSWVAVWVLSFTLTVPSNPTWAIVAALASACVVPLVTALATSLGYMPAAPPVEFFLHVVLPYLIVVVVAAVGARVIYSLSVDLKRALDLGSYSLEERLGFGGMGEVWRARHRFLARPAAVKLIRPEVFQGATGDRQTELRARFEREAQTTAALHSPHTVTLFDYGMTEEGAFYYVMELLDGFDMKTLVDRFGPLPAGRVVHLVQQACHSLAEAHQVGLVHRDITPANIFVCRYGRDVDFVKVLDFGLVKPKARVQGDESGFSRADRIGGTPAFMSPEQALGDRPLDGRSDLYALGCVAYFLLTGSLVFQKATPTALAVAHAQAVPEPPSQRTELPIPPALDAVVLACLAKAPEDRPPTADHLAQRLEDLADVPRWGRGQARAWWDLHAPIDVARRRATAGPASGKLVRPQR